MLKGGARQFDNRVAWARFYLAKAGYLDASQRGVWSLTELGRSRVNLGHGDAVELFKSLHASFASARKEGSITPEEEDVAPESVAEPAHPAVDFRQDFLQRLQSLSSEGFERFARRLLLEAGFQEVEVTGRSGDGGIDGIGRLQVNSLVSTKVLFQCKRYLGSVGSDKVRDFRGAMAGRSDNGIIITTGTFTSDARREALREGVAPIELVDSVRLIALCEQLRLGLKPLTTFEIDLAFLAEFA